jgi:hypothetical protein
MAGEYARLWDCLTNGLTNDTASDTQGCSTTPRLIYPLPMKFSSQARTMGGRCWRSAGSPAV